MKLKAELFFPQVNRQSRTAFGATVVFMLVTHLYMFTNKLVNHDDVNRLINGDTDEVKIQHGRWAGVLLDRISGSSFGIPYILGMLSILAFALTAVMLVSVFRLQSRGIIILCCALLSTFPVSANIFLYSYIADAYFISMLLAIWGIWLLLQGTKLQMGTGILLLTLSCGTYQAFWCLGMGVLFLYYLLEYLRWADKAKVLGYRIVKSLVGAAVSLVLYLIINWAIQTFTGYGATAYKGLDSMGQFGGVIGLLKVIAGAYYEFILFFYWKGFFVNSNVLMVFNILLTLLVIGLMIFQGSRQKHTMWFWIGLVLIIGFLPSAFNLVSVVSKNATHTLMQYAFMLPYLLCLVLLDRFTIQNGKAFMKKCQKGILAVAFILLGIIAYKGYLTDNELYFRQQLYFEQAYSYTLRMLSRIEEVPDYDPSVLVALINETPQGGDHISILMENYPEEMLQLNYLKEMAGTEPYTLVKRANDVADFCKYYHGYDLRMADMEDLPSLAESDAFAKMPTYPQEGSMQYIEGVLVIKLPDAK